MFIEYIVNACSGKRIELSAGQKITIIDIEGGQVVDFFAERSGNAREFLSPGVTIDCNASLKLTAGDHIYSNLYRPMFEVIYDGVGEHDLLHPCCRPEMYDFFYGNGTAHPINIFMYTKINTDGSISVERPLSKAGY